MSDYVKQHTIAKFRVGIVITIALVIIFLAVMFAGNIEKLFSPQTMLYAMTGDVKGLREGSPVWFSGVEIGSVKSIEFTSQQKVRVGMSIASASLTYLKSDSKANILTLGLLGDKYVEITPGSKEAKGLKAGDTIAGETQIEIQDVVQASESSIAKISQFVSMLEEILMKIDQGQGTVTKFIKDPAVYDSLKKTLDELATLVRKMESGKGMMGRLLNDESLYVNLSSSVEDVKLFADSLKKSEGTLNKLIQDPSLYDRFQRASSSLDTFTQKLLTSKGTMNRLIEDESLYENVDSASRRLNTLLGRIENGQGLMGSLVKDDELSQELKSTLKELNALVKDIKDHPGHYFKFSIF